MMTNGTIGGELKDAAPPFKAAADQVESLLTYLKKLQAKLTKAAKDYSSGKPATALSRLVEDLRKADEIPTLVPMSELASQLEASLEDYRRSAGERFIRTAIALAHAAGLSSKSISPERLAIGPFAVTPDLHREEAELSFAKVTVARVPLDPDTVIRAATELADSLLTPTVIDQFANNLDEAIRVATARSGKPATGRAELPAVYRELRAIGLLESRPRQYTLPQFVVDLKTLVQSDANLHGRRRFRLETAVLENAKDKAKSIFIPADLAAGYGEGTYFQAVVVENAA